MNHAFMVNDSISPSTQPTTSHAQDSKGFSSFRDTYEKGLSVRNDEVNISCCAKELFNESSKKNYHIRTVSKIFRSRLQKGLRRLKRFFLPVCSIFLC